MLFHHLLQISTHVLGHKLRGAQISVELLLGLSDHPFASVNFIKILRPLGAVFYQLGLLLSQLGFVGPPLLNGGALLPLFSAASLGPLLWAQHAAVCANQFE